MPAEVEQMMAGMQMASRKTDRTDVIEGIKAGEREISLSLKLPLPATPPADGTTPAAPPAVEMKIVMHLWTALPGEIDRVPALRELDGVMSSGNGSMFGRDFIQQLSVMLPFAGDSMTKLMEELSKDHAYPLRTQMDLSMPGMAEMLAQLGPSGAGGSPDFPKGPLMSMTMEVTEWSTAAIDEAVFQVPQDYKPAPFADLLKKLNK
jgi:hypothetical protein